MYNQLICR